MQRSHICIDDKQKYNTTIDAHASSVKRKTLNSGAYQGHLRPAFKKENNVPCADCDYELGNTWRTGTTYTRIISIYSNNGSSESWIWKTQVSPENWDVAHEPMRDKTKNTSFVELDSCAETSRCHLNRHDAENAASPTHIAKSNKITWYIANSIQRWSWRNRHALSVKKEN